MNLKEFESIMPPPFHLLKIFMGSNIFLSKACKKKKRATGSLWLYVVLME